VDPPGEVPTAEHDGVLDAALSAFLEFGIRRTSMGEIARRGGVSPASLYRWFGGKEDIVSAVVARDLRQFTADLDDLVDRGAPPDEQLTDLALGVARKLVSQPLLERLIQTEPETVLPQLTVDAGPLIELGVTYLAELLQRFMDEGQIERFDPVPVAEIFIRLFHSLILTPTTSFPFDDEERLRALAHNTILGLLRLPPRSRPPQGANP
jgi:AcrR family transcriptional regulator